MTQSIPPLRSVGQSQALLGKVHTHAIDLIENCGVRFHSRLAREVLHGAGAKVDGDVVKIPGNVIESALKKAPSHFSLCARDPKYDLPLDGSRTYLSQDGCAALVVDFETGELRRSCREDIEKMAAVADHLDAVDIVTPTVSAQDSPSTARSVYELEACFANTGKHVVTESVLSAREAQGQIDLAAAVTGGKDKLRERPIFSNFVCTISPLCQDAGGIEAGTKFAEAGIPVGFYSMATAGVTSPVTLAGTLAVANAEIISALTLMQLAVPGAKVLYAGGPATVDLRTCGYSSSSPEALWLRMMIAEMANYYGLPSIAGAGATSAKVWDPQAGWENAMSLILPTLAGASFLFGIGLLYGSNLLSYEGLILDAEIAMLVRKTVSAVDLDDSAFAVDLVKELGPGGVYLGEEHTVRHMRETLSMSMLSDRDTFDEWVRKGKPDRVEAARQKVRDIIANHRPLPLPVSVPALMKEVLTEYCTG